MSISLSDLTISTFVGGLGTLRSVVAAGERHATSESMAPTDLIDARLVADMFTFAQNVQAATDTARRVTERLAGGEPSSRPDPEPSFAALTQRVNETLELIKAADGPAIDAAETRELKVDLGQEMTFTGRSYVLTFALPNFLFHVTTAYDILRYKGVQLGKRDYIAPFIVG